MFGQIIKGIRRELGLTQKDFSVVLANKSEEFRQIDFVTISRWEREKTLPNKARAVRVLRTLGKDLRPYLRHLSETEQISKDTVEEFVFERFHSPLLQKTLAVHGLAPSREEANIGHDKAFLKVNDPMLEVIKSYHSRFNQKRLQQFSMDLYLYQEEGKLHGYRFYSPNEPENILGYSIAFFFKQQDLENQIESQGCEVDFTKAARYKIDETLSIFFASGSVISSSLFKYNLTHQLKFLAEHSNITLVFVSIRIEAMVSFLTNIGFEIVATENPIKKGKGGVKVGRRYYESCIMKIDTSVLLTSKEALYLLQNEL